MEQQSSGGRARRDAAGEGSPPVAKPWSRSVEEVLEALEVSRREGLTASEVTARRERWGPNRLRESRRRTAWAIVVDQFKSLIVVLLSGAAVVALAFGETVEAVAIVAVLAINAAIGFVAELRAVRSMEALRQLGSVSARVRRGGAEQTLPADELVPGDLVLVDEGDVITADLRLLEANNLEADESALTGESVPVAKAVEAVAPAAPVTDRDSMLHKGTAVTRGSGEGVVVGTGMATQLGEIARLTYGAEEEATPLEERLERLGRRLIGLTLVIAAATSVAGILGGRDVLLMIETGIALAVAAVPEGLPIVATLALARGMWRMARRNALINRLSAVETLGATTLIFTDKTGTLTENRMTVRRLWLPSERADVGEVGVQVEVEGEGLELEGAFRAAGEEVDPAALAQLRRLLEAAVLCNNATLARPAHDAGEGPEGIGDPLEVALLVAGVKAGVERSRLLEEAPEEREVAFDRDTKMMATFHRHSGADGEPFRLAVKGAAEAVLAASTRAAAGDGSEPLDEAGRRRWLERNAQLAEDGLRVIAVAEGRRDTAEADPYRELTFVGLVGLLDPPRQEVRPAIDGCHSAGLRVVMVTGDQPATAGNIARAVGLAAEGEEVVAGSELAPAEALSDDERRRLLAAPVFARVDPAQKLDLIALHQGAGEVVAMTGDGVNDAPALKKADIGIAMGRRGTQVAREAADMVLEDDAFTSIVAAVRQGRIIFDNIRRFVLYLLSCNVSEILIVGGATAVGAPLPILPLQILFLNLVTDVFPALALGFGEGEEGIMEEPPRDPGEPLLTRAHWLAVGGYGLLITGAVLAALFGALRWLGHEPARATTVSFLTLALAQLWHVFNMRSPRSTLLRNQITRNRWVWGALALCVVLLLVAVYLPVLSDVLALVDPGAGGWALALGLSLLPWGVGQAIKGVQGRR